MVLNEVENVDVEVIDVEEMAVEVVVLQEVVMTVMEVEMTLDLWDGLILSFLFAFGACAP